MVFKWCAPFLALAAVAMQAWPVAVMAGVFALIAIAEAIENKK